jgi:hypothetical protein
MEFASMNLNRIHILRVDPGKDMFQSMYKEITLAITPFTQGPALMALSEAALAGFLGT